MPKTRTSKQKPAAAEETDSPLPLQEQLLDLIRLAAQECGKVESEFGTNPPPELETLIKVHRVLVLRLANRDLADPKVLPAITQLMRPVMEYARLEEVRRRRELAEEKYREEREAEKAERAEQEQAAAGGDALTPKTVEQIERELKLF